jgi:hypothetical protein
VRFLLLPVQRRGNIPACQTLTRRADQRGLIGSQKPRANWEDDVEGAWVARRSLVPGLRGAPASEGDQATAQLGYWRAPLMGETIYSWPSAWNRLGPADPLCKVVSHTRARA